MGRGQAVWEDSGHGMEARERGVRKTRESAKFRSKQKRKEGLALIGDFMPDLYKQ